MKKTIILVLAITGMALSCNKSDAPNCIDKKLKDFKKDPTCSSGAYVKEYIFQDAKVYVFEPGNCIADGTANVYDEDCNVLGYLGGITGNNVINGENFNTAQLTQTLWSN